MILWGAEHQARAEALATAYKEQSSAVASLPRGSAGLAAPNCNDSTLTVWGHGDAQAFSEMSAPVFAALILAWKAKNPALATVEIVTCDARHNNDGLASYASSVAAIVHAARKSIVIKALPVGQHPDDSSILWASVDASKNGTFCYITAPSAATFTNANQLLQALTKTPPVNLNVATQALAKKRGNPPNDFTVTGGNFNNLRSYLGVIQ